MRHRRAEVGWALLLIVPATLPLLQLLVATSELLPLLMIVCAGVAGRRMASLSLALGVFAAALVTSIALVMWRSPDPLTDWVELVTSEFITVVLPWSIGRYQRLRVEQRDRERRIVADHARLRERARIAQDMHDSLGHELALIALRGGVLELADDLRDDQRRAVAELRAGAVRATDRLREIVRVLGRADAAADLQPPDETIDDLVRRAASAGLPVQLRRSGTVVTEPPMTSQAAHRVVQEALTNAARHAPGAPVTVTVAGDGGGSRVIVVNDAPPRPGSDAGAGQGLVGLDERVRLAGGRFEAGPRPGGGWAVTAVFPGDEPPFDDDPSPLTDPDVSISKRLTRRRQLQTAALPVGIGLALVAAILVVNALSVARSGLAHERYDDLRPGQTRAEIAPLLPSQSVGRAPPVIAEPPRPAGSSCAYYQAGTGLLEFGADLYRLCFADGVLVSKDRMERA